MERDTKRILLQVLETVREELGITASVERRLNRLESSRPDGASNGCVDGLADRVERLAEQVRRHC
jgi:hypothetical protein